MFSVFAFLTLLLAVLPVNSVAANHANSRNPKVAAHFNVSSFPTPTGVTNAVNYITGNLAYKNGNPPVTPPAQIVSQSAHDNHGNSEGVVITPPDNTYPTPTIHPVPVVTDSPTPTPDEDEPVTLVPGPGVIEYCPPGPQDQNCFTPNQ